MYGNNSRYYGNPLLRTEDKSPPETTKKCMETTPAIRNTRCYGQKLNPRPKLQRNVWKQLPLLQNPLLRTEDKSPTETTSESTKHSTRACPYSVKLKPAGGGRKGGPKTAKPRK